MGKNKKSTLATVGKKKRVVTEPSPSSTDSEGEDSGASSPGSGRSGKGGRNGTIRHVYTTNSDMDCIEEYLKPVYKDGEVILDVECGSNKAMMYLSKLCQGSKGPCVEFQGSWLTPNEFQYVSGRETAKDWKRSIRHQGKSMKLLLTKGVLSVHSTVCDCDGCRLTSPVNRCRLAEKRKSVYSTNRKERLTLESFTSCETSLSGTPDIAEGTEVENETTTVEKEDPQTKKTTVKNCSPLRESRLSNIIDQLRTSKEKETSSEIQFKKEFCDDENRTRDENGNEGEDDADLEQGRDTPETTGTPEGKPEAVVKEPTEDKTEETVLSDSREEMTADPPCAEESADKEDKLVTKEPEIERAEEVCAETPVVAATSETIPENTAKLEKLEVDEPKPEEIITQDIPKEENKHSPTGSDENKPDRVVAETSPEDIKVASPTHNEVVPHIPSPEPVPAKHRHIEKDSISDLSSATPAVPDTPKIEKKDPVVSSQGIKRLCEYKSPKLTAPCTSRKDRREEKEAKSKSLVVKKSTAAAPTQDYLASLSCPTALPASVPEQFLAGDMPAAKYSDFIRLLAASHLGGHIPLAPDRLIGENMQAFPMASNFNGLPHPFPAYPFFPHQLPLKDSPPFQVPPMSMPPPFLPPYMYRPLGLLPHTLVDPAKYAHLNAVPEAFRPSPNESAADAPRKRHSDTDSALDLSTKRFKFDDRLVSSSGSNYHLSRKTPSQTSSCHRDKKTYVGRQERDSPSSTSKLNKAEELKGLNAKTDFSSERQSNSRRECSCLSSRKDDIRLWSVTEVGQFLKTLDGCSVYAATFREHRVDGKSLPLLTVEHLMQNIGMKLGPAVLLTKTVAKRLKVSKHAQRKCPKCENKQSGLKSPITCNIGMGRVF